MALRPLLRRFADRHPTLVQPVRRPLLALEHRMAARDHRAMQQVIDHLAAALVEDPCVRVPEFQGSFYLDARSALLRRLLTTGHYEPELSALCIAHLNPARDALDIGANVGFHAVLFGRQLQQGRVLSVEPTRNALRRLQRNVAHNGVADRVIVHHGAVAAAAGTVELHTIEGREEFSSLADIVHPAVAGEAVQVESVQAEPLDALVARYGLDPAFLKIDVEGAELGVLQGASQVLRQHRPIILAELSDPLLRANGTSAQAVVDFIAGFDYDIRDPLRPDAVPGTREYGDILCRPR